MGGKSTKRREQTVLQHGGNIAKGRLVRVYCIDKYRRGKGEREGERRQKESGYWSLIVRDEAVILENKKQDGKDFFFGCVLPFILRDDCRRCHCLLGVYHEAKAEVDWDRVVPSSSFQVRYA